MFTLDHDQDRPRQIDSLTVQLFEKALEARGLDAPYTLVTASSRDQLIAGCRATAEALLTTKEVAPVAIGGLTAKVANDGAMVITTPSGDTIEITPRGAYVNDVLFASFGETP